MNIYRTDLNLLIVFDSIYSQGSVTKASETLHLTQPTISHALSRLREQIGDPLFVRSGQRLVPTATAHKLIHPIREALQTIESALSDIDEFDPTSATNRFTLGMRPLIEGAFFPTLSTQIARQSPGIALSSVHFNRDNLVTELTSGRINAAIDVFLSLPDSIQRKQLSSAPIVVVARRDHPAIEDGSINLARYLEATHLLVSSRPEGLGAEDLMLAREGKKRRVITRCQQISTGLELVLHSDLLMTVAKSLVSQQLVPKLHHVSLAPFNAPHIDTYLYWHASSNQDRASLWLRSNIESAFRKAG